MSGFIPFGPGEYEWRGEPGSAIPVWVPAPPKPAPLTDDQIAACWPTAFAMPESQRKTLLKFARAVIERALIGGEA